MRPHPIDLEPSAKGNILIGVTALVLTKTQLAVARAQKAPLYTSHFATCPDAADHRQGKLPGLGS